jgi:hypothetical protein
MADTERKLKIKSSIRDMLNAVEDSTITKKSAALAAAAAFTVGAVGLTGLAGSTTFDFGSEAFSGNNETKARFAYGLASLVLARLTVSGGSLSVVGLTTVFEIGGQMKASIKEMVKSPHGMYKDFTKNLPNEALLELTNVNSVLEMLGEKGKRVYLVGSQGQGPGDWRIVDEKGLKNFLNAQTDSEYIMIRESFQGYSIQRHVWDKEAQEKAAVESAGNIRPECVRDTIRLVAGIDGPKPERVPIGWEPS